MSEGDCHRGRHCKEHCAEYVDGFLADLLQEGADDEWTDDSREVEDATSAPNADAMRSGRTVSATSARLTGKSVAQTIPARNAPTDTCQTAIRSVMTSAASTTYIAARDRLVAMSIVLRFKRSASAPMNAPRSSIGTMRRNPTKPTRNAEPVKS